MPPGTEAESTPGGAPATSRQSGYLVPRADISELLDAPPLPAVALSPTGRHIALLEEVNLPDARDISASVLRVGPWRVDPSRNADPGPWMIRTVRIACTVSGRTVELKTPANKGIIPVGYSKNGAHFAFAVLLPDGVKLGVAHVGTGRVRIYEKRRLNATLLSRSPDGNFCRWFADGRRVLCRVLPGVTAGSGSREDAPRPPTVLDATRAAVQSGGAGLSMEDARVLTRYFTSQLAVVDIESGQFCALGRPGLYARATPSPDGDFVLATWLDLSDAGRGRIDACVRTAIRRLDGGVVGEVAVASASAADMGSEGYHNWALEEPATVVWSEPCQGKAAGCAHNGEHVLSWSRPFRRGPTKWFELEGRLRGIWWSRDGFAIVAEDRPARPGRLWMVPRDSGVKHRLPARGHEMPLTLDRTPDSVLAQDGRSVFLAEREAPNRACSSHVDRVDPDTGVRTRVLPCTASRHEVTLGFTDVHAGSVLVRTETARTPPSYSVRECGDGVRRTLVSRPDPGTVLARCERHVLRYRRRDGTELLGLVHLPPNVTMEAIREDKKRLPVVMWIYPRPHTECIDSARAMLMKRSRFRHIRGPSPTLLTLLGYAVLENPMMPLVGRLDEAMDSFVEQMLANAAAAIDALVTAEIGSRDRVLVGGHSYGAFVVANLLAHSRLFRAGIARSGAYNRSTTPLGYQNEPRRIWEAPETYCRVSPLWVADRIRDPLLILHGALDGHPATDPLQARAFFEALRGAGVPARYVQLPHESHESGSREGVHHAVSEMALWCRQHLHDPLHDGDA